MDIEEFENRIFEKSVATPVARCTHFCFRPQVVVSYCLNHVVEGCPCGVLGLLDLADHKNQVGILLQSGIAYLYEFGCKLVMLLHLNARRGTFGQEQTHSNPNKNPPILALIPNTSSEISRDSRTPYTPRSFSNTVPNRADKYN
jgi:hypothetical protein